MGQDAERRELVLRTGSWHRDAETRFLLPAGWSSRVLAPADAPPLSPKRVRASFRHPLELPSIAEAARGARNAVLLVDDLARPTPAEPVCLAAMDNLNGAGIADSAITILAAGGAHLPLNETELRLKLGSAYDRAGLVEAHDAFASPVEYLGAAGDGAPILVNRHAVEADFKLAVTSVYPNAAAGYGGGAKIVLPGISHISAIHWLHSRLKGAGRGCRPSASPFRRAVEEAAARLGLDALAAVVVNARREIAGLYVGTPRAAFRQAVRRARHIYRTPMPDVSRFDLILANAYPFDGEPTQVSKSYWPMQQFGLPGIVIADFVRPLLYHGWYDGPYASFARRPPVSVRQRAREWESATTMLFSPQFGSTFRPHRRDWPCENDWPRLMRRLGKRFPRARVMVFPVAPLQWAEE